MRNYDHVLDLLKLKQKKNLKCEFTQECILELPHICDHCLHKTLRNKFSSWTSGNKLIDRFIRKTQLLSSYEQYPEWVLYSSLSEFKHIGEGGFGTVYSTIWSWGIKTKDLNMHYRTGPCKVALKKLKGEMKITEAFLSEVQAQFDFCHLYGITQDPKTEEYMFIMRFAPQGDLRRYLLRNFDNLSLPNKLGIAQTICAELEKIHSKGWVHVCGVIAFADRSHDVHLIVDICDGLRPQTCHFAPPVYNDLLERCWNRDPSKRPCIKDVLNSIEFWCYHRRQTDVVIINNIIGSNLFRSNYKTISNNIRLYDKNDRFEKNGFHKCGCFDETITNQLANSQNAGYIYTLMNWKPNKPIHSEAVYSSRTFSYKSLQDEIDILLSWRKSNQKSNQSSIVK
ncbi:unnamed protein product [Rhizophagus irregularis]|nr:unnamed protein product [Rhizophagus irregularis]